MATNFDFGLNDAQTVKLWSELVNRDAEKQMIWGPMMYSADGGNAVRHPDAAKGQGIIKVHTEFESKRGKSVTLNNVARVVGRGVQGDGLLRDTAADLDTYSMELFFENYAQQVKNTGELADQYTVMNFRQVARPELASWVRRKIEGAVVLSLWGLTAPSNSGVLTQLNWNTVETSVFQNDIEAFDTDHIFYAGDATSAATVDSGDVVTAQSLSELERQAMEGLDIPLEPINIDGEDCFLLFLGGKGCNQLRYDQDWKDANTFFTKGTNPMLKRAIGKFGMIYVINYANALNVSANVGRGILAGKDALQVAKVKEPSWFEDYADTRKRIALISIGGMMGVAPTKFNSTRRNSMAFDHYISA